MKIIILLIFCAASFAQNLPDAKPLEAPVTKDTKNQKRQTPTSYSSNIAHGTSEDGKEAHSSVSVNFGDKEISQIKPQRFQKPQVSFKQNIQQKPIPKRQSVQSIQIVEEPQQPQQPQPQPQINVYPTPKTILDYIKHEIPTTEPHVQEGQQTKEEFVTTSPHVESSNLLAPLLVQNQAPLFTKPQNHHYPQHQGFRHREKNPQLFNVGYSINIMNHEPQLKFRLPRPKIRGDIITGAHKDTVGKPSELNIVESSLGQNYLQGPTEINYPIKVFPTSYVDVNSNNKVPLPTNKEGYVWKNLSPSVEISGYLSQEDQLQAQHFDHEGALGKSESFDSSNALDAEPVVINSKQSFQEFKTNLHDPKLPPEQNLYEKFYKNNPVFYKSEIPQVSLPQRPIVEIFKPQVPDLTVFPQQFDQKLVIPTPHDQKFLRLSPEFQKYTPQYQIHENVNEGHPNQFYRQGRFFPGPPRNFGPPPQPYRFRYARDGRVQYLRPPPIVYRMPKYMQ